MDLHQSFVLGIVQGLTEFLPISSTAHLRIVPHMLGWQDPGAAFSAVIQLGTLVAVLWYFRKDIVTLTRAALESIWQRNWAHSQDSKLAWAIALGNIPIVVLGLTLKDFIEGEARSLQVIATALIVLGVLLYLVERVSKRDKSTETLTFVQVQLIGLCQALALIPGCSRSGSTIMGGFLVGLNRESAARFSFLLGLPAITGSGIFEWFSLIKEPQAPPTLIVLVGIASAFVSGYLSISFLIRFLKRYGTAAFMGYRVLLGAAILLYL